MDDHTLLETIQMAIKLSKLEQHPVGSIYTSIKPTDPHELFGGTWEPIQDTFLWCAGPKHAAGTTGGEETHTLTVEEMPAHLHGLTRYVGTDDKNFSGHLKNGLCANDSQDYSAADTDATGGDQPHNNMPPYKSVYAWERVK